MRPEIERAVALLRAGELVVFPTETVYGLGADALNPAALGKVFSTKGRPANHPLIVHLPESGQLSLWASEVPPEALSLAAAFWPGPLTLILKRQPQVPDAVTGGQNTVGLRVPNHPLAQELLCAFGGGIAAPSANRFGRISPTTADHVRSDLGDAISLILDGGPCQVGIESTIIDLTGGRANILRPGAITAAEIEGVIGRPIGSIEGKAPRVSGSLEAHYAPRTPMKVVPSADLLRHLQSALLEHSSIAVLARTGPLSSAAQLYWHQASSDPAAYAQELYASLRQLDKLVSDLILVESPPATPEWLAVCDRLGRAACGAGGSHEERSE